MPRFDNNVPALVFTTLWIPLATFIIDPSLPILKLNIKFPLAWNNVNFLLAPVSKVMICGARGFDISLDFKTVLAFSKWDIKTLSTPLTRNEPFSDNIGIFVTKNGNTNVDSGNLTTPDTFISFTTNLATALKASSCEPDLSLQILSSKTSESSKKYSSIYKV